MLKFDEEFAVICSVLFGLFIIVLDFCINMDTG
jgi:hypothetical protein